MADQRVSSGRAFETERNVAGVGPVHERIISREPSAVREGACAGTLEFGVPGAPGGAQVYTAHVACGPESTSVIRATRRDPSSARTWMYQPTLDQLMRARGLVLQDRTDAVHWYVPDAVYEAASWTAVAHALGHAHDEAEGTSHKRQLVVAMGLHQGWPGPRGQWDDVQVAVLDEAGTALARLSLDAADIGTRTGIHLQKDGQGNIVELGFVGLARDGAGAWRWVDLLLRVKPVEAQPGAGMQPLVDAMATSRKLHVLVPADGGGGHLWVDGREWLNVDALAGAVDQVLHRPASVIGGELTLNASPADGPFLLTADATTGRVRMAFDRTLMGDTRGLLLKLPVKLRAGWGHINEHIGADGKRTNRSDVPTGVHAPYASRSLRFSLPTGQGVRVTQQLVGVRAEDGVMEYGLRQVAALED